MIPRARIEIGGTNFPIPVDAMRRSNSQKDISVGLARPVAQSGMLIAYTAREGATAANGTGDNSPYAIALARHLIETRVDVRVLFGEAHEHVLTASGARMTIRPCAAGIPSRSAVSAGSPTADRVEIEISSC